MVKKYMKMVNLLFKLSKKWVYSKYEVRNAYTISNIFKVANDSAQANEVDCIF